MRGNHPALRPCSRRSSRSSLRRLAAGDAARGRGARPLLRDGGARGRWPALSRSACSSCSRRPVPWRDLPRLGSDRALPRHRLSRHDGGRHARRVPSAHGGVILGLLPIATAVAAVFVAGERPSPFFWLMSVLGAALVVAFSLRGGAIVPARGRPPPLRRGRDLRHRLRASPARCRDACRAGR